MDVTLVLAENITQSPRTSPDILAGPQGSIAAFIDSPDWAALDDAKVTLVIYADYGKGFRHQTEAIWTSYRVRAALDAKPPMGKSPILGPIFSWEPTPGEPTPIAFRVLLSATHPRRLAVKVQVR